MLLNLLHLVYALRVATTPPVLESETFFAESRDEKPQLLPEDVHGPSSNDGDEFYFTFLVRQQRRH